MVATRLIASRLVSTRPDLRAKAAIFNGQRISIADAPWQVALLVQFGKGKTTCGGSIISDSKILTAAHCFFVPDTGEMARPDNVEVIAGAENILPKVVDQDHAVQRTTAASIRLPLAYKFEPGVKKKPYDIAVLTLAKSLAFNQAVRAIPLYPVNSVNSVQPADGTEVTLTGFGRQSNDKEADGYLYALKTTLVPRGECREDAPLFLCSKAARGSACHGDSGSGLTVGSPAMLIGVQDFGDLKDKQCIDGGFSGYANVMAPEIRGFIEER
jgi:secreted trypsin-like serine protease